MGPAGGRAGGADARRDLGTLHSRARGPAFWGDSSGLFAVVFLSYAGFAALSWESFGSAVGPAFFYPSAGVTVAAMLLSRRAVWPAVVAAVVAAEVLIDTYYGNPLSMAFGFAVANVVEPLVGATLVLIWCGGRPDLRRRRDLMLFIAGACLTGPVFGGLIGGTVSSAHAQTAWLPTALNWWSGDALGVLVMGAPILLWATQSYVVRVRPWETAGVLAVSAVLSFTAFWSEAPPSLLILPVLAWAALRLDMLGASMAGAVVAFLANIMSTRGKGFVSSLAFAPSTEVLLTQAFVATVVVVAMLIAQEASGRLSAVRDRETERRERLRLETLSALAQQLSAAITPHDIGRALEEQVINDAGAKALSLGLVGPDGATLEWVVMSGYPRAVVDTFGSGVAVSERTVTTDVVRYGEPIMVRTPGEYAQLYPEKAHWSRISGSVSTAGWPLASGGKPVGALLLVWSEPQPFNEAQRAYISAVATMVSQALVRARIYADEHARAAVLQAAVLPTTPVQTSGLDVGVTYEPADVSQGLGGDWYDVMQLPKNRTYLAVGDVVGHGLPAVEDMAQLRSAGRALAHQGLSPAQLLAELNGFTRNASQGKFATMAVAIFDPNDGTLAYCSAGHPPPFFRRSDTGEVSRLTDARGPVLGPVEDATYTGGSVQVHPDDMLVMYTDGLVERHGLDIETGIAAAERMIAEWDSGASVGRFCEILQERLAPRPRADDVCVLAVRFTADDLGPSAG
ncbi:MAG: SpoIIE family protein phosphatase [Mycobacterium sp.]